MKLIVFYIILALVTSNQVFASGKVAELEEAFKQYEANKEVQIKDNKEIESIYDLIANEQHSIPQALNVLQKIKNGNLKVETQELETLYKLYEKRTKKFRYPNHWRYVKSIDYDEMVCKEINKLMAVLKKKQSETD